MSRLSQLEDFPDDDYYLGRMKDILEGYPKLGPLQHPSKLLEHVYIGNQDNADNLDLLQALEITHVLNCAGTRTFDLTRSPYRPETGIIGFLMMPAEDYEEFDIMHYFMDAIIFLDKVKTAGGRALVHCNIGVNRSGAIVAAYLMIHQKRPLLKVIEDLKSKRSLILQNVGFRHQLIRFARCRGLLDPAERPPKKPTITVNGFKSGNKDVLTLRSQDRNETVKSVSNGTSNLAEEVVREPSEVSNKGTNGQLSKEKISEEQSLDERKTFVSSKYAGYENDLGNSDDKTERSYGKLSYLDIPGVSSEDKLNKLCSKLSYLDLGNHRIFTNTEGTLLNRSTSSLTGNNSYNSDYLLSNGHSVEFSIGEDPLSAKQSLELFQPRLPTSTVHNGLSYTNLPSESVQSSHLYLPTPAALLSQRASRESSISDLTNSIHASLDDVDITGKYTAPVSSSYFDSDSISREFPASSLSKITKKHIPVIAAAENFVSNVKPRSYYKNLVSRLPRLNNFEEEDDFVVLSRPTRLLPKSQIRYEGNGMLFTPYLASSSSSSSLSSDSLSQPKSYFYPRNTPYNRSSLSDLESLSSDEFSLQPSTALYRSYRPSSSSNHRSLMEYDDAVDEYSDLLDASRGRSNAISAVSKCRASYGFRKAYKY